MISDDCYRLNTFNLINRNGIFEFFYEYFSCSFFLLTASSFDRRHQIHKWCNNFSDDGEEDQILLYNALTNTHNVLVRVECVEADECELIARNAIIVNDYYVWFSSFRFLNTWKFSWLIRFNAFWFIFWFLFVLSFLSSIHCVVVRGVWFSLLSFVQRNAFVGLQMADDEFQSESGQNDRCSIATISTTSCGRRLLCIQSFKCLQ